MKRPDLVRYGTTPHPASLLLAWLAMAMMLQSLNLPWLLALTIPVFGPALWWARSHFLAMLRRTRWLLLSILLLFALATPGEPLPGLTGTLGLTLEGCRLALSHALRLTLLLALLALLLEHMCLPELISGLHTLLAPLGHHPQRQRIALRLLLVLQYVEQTRQHKQNLPSLSSPPLPHTLQNWQDWLLSDPVVNEGSPPQLERPIELPIAPLTLFDKLLMLLALLMTAVVYLHAPPQ